MKPPRFPSAVLLLVAVAGLAAQAEDELPVEEVRLFRPLRRAAELLAADEFDAALEILEGEARHRPRDGELLALLGAAAWRAGQVERSVEIFSLANRGSCAAVPDLSHTPPRRNRSRFVVFSSSSR